jgi:hypothetical protein
VEILEKTKVTSIPCRGDRAGREREKEKEREKINYRDGTRFFV